MFEAWSRLKKEWVRRFEWEKSVWGKREKFLSRERSEKWYLIRTQPLNRNRSSMDRDICRALNLNKNEYVEVLSRIYWRQKHLDRSKKLSRIYRKETQKSWWIEIPLESVETRRKKGSIEGNLSRSYQVWRKWVFRRRKKHIEMNAISKLLKNRSNQHIKLLKHLLTNMQSIQRSKTHTHTHNKSNQFYISKTS